MFKHLVIAVSLVNLIKKKKKTFLAHLKVRKKSHI